MKFVAFFAFVATVCATTSTLAWTTTTIHLSTHIVCGKFKPPISECGANNLFDYNMAAAKVVYKGQPVIFYNVADCTGLAIYLDHSVDCLELEFRPKCVLIKCF